MVRKGRPCSPDSVRAQRGAYRGRQPRLDGSTVTPPAHMMGKPAAVAFWNDKAPPLLADGRLNSQNVDSFVLLCQYHAEALEHQAKIDAEGTVIKTTKGMVPHPATMLLSRARRDFLRVAQDFGLTPVSYARLPAEKKTAQEDAEAALLRKFTG